MNVCRTRIGRLLCLAFSSPLMSQRWGSERFQKKDKNLPLIAHRILMVIWRFRYHIYGNQRVMVFGDL